MKTIPLGTEDILLKRNGSIAVVSINRPAKRNAMTLAMWKELTRIYRMLAADAAVRAVVLTGNGGVFGSGADISEFPAVRHDPESAAAYDLVVDHCAEAVMEMPKPTVAAISGVCGAGILSPVLACDFRIADRTATFFLPPAKIGIVYGIEKCRRVMSIVGITNAKKILYSGKMFGVDQALATGLVDQVVDGDVVMSAVEFVQEMTQGAPLAVAGIKEILEAIAADQVEQRRPRLEAAIRRADASQDQREAARAFMEKRSPVFRGE